MFFVDSKGGVIYSNSTVMVCYLICSDIYGGVICS